MEFDTVVGASKHQQKTTEAPASVSIVTKEDIKELGYRTLADVLRGVRGFYLTFDRDYYFTGTRGVNRPGDYGGRILLNINGHRLNEPIYDSLLVGREFPLDVDLIERVEVIRGPGASGRDPQRGSSARPVLGRGGAGEQDFPRATSRDARRGGAQ